MPTITIQAAAGQIEAAALQTLLTDLTSHFAYMILASPEDRIFETFDVSQASDLATWPEGIVFGPRSELRWRPKNGKFAVCFLTEAATLPAAVQALPEQETAQVSREALQIRLWGEHNPTDVAEDDQPVWFEAQIPRLLAYPLNQSPASKNVALKVCQYRRADQSVAFVRFVELVAT